ncbi:hypothetical protein V6N13_138258 [Hibiscus sabdariffa]
MTPLVMPQLQPSSKTGDSKKISSFSVNETEAEAIKFGIFGISCPRAGGFHNIIVESDNARLIERLRQLKRYSWQFRLLCL